jgi:hypothetical protein
MKLTITQIGSPKTVTTKYGDKRKSYIKAKEHGDKFLNIWCNKETDNWKEGSVVEVEDVVEREYNGKMYYDVKQINKDTQQANELGQIKFALAKHDFQIKELQEQVKKLVGVKEEVQVPEPNFDKDSKGNTINEPQGYPDSFTSQQEEEIELPDF